MEEANNAEYAQLQLSSANGPIFRRVKRTPARAAKDSEIPMIDISGIFSEALLERQAVAEQVHLAATTIGFFYIYNHGIAEDLTSAASQSALRFFRQTREQKEPVNTKYIEGYDGWKPAQTQRINSSESVDQREMFSITYAPSNDPTIINLDSVPAEVMSCLTKGGFPWEKTTTVSGFQENVLDYDRACLNLARCLTRTFALSLSLPEDFFDSKVRYPDTSLAMNYYPPLVENNAPVEEEEVSIGSHTDFQLFTMLWQDTSGGLQVLSSKGEWIHAAPIPGTLVVNIADYLQRITNDRYVSTVHRVKNHSGKERLSMPFFFGFGSHETCGVLESCTTEDQPAKYEPISCEEWIRLRVANTNVKEENPQD